MASQRTAAATKSIAETRRRIGSGIRVASVATSTAPMASRMIRPASVRFWLAQLQLLEGVFRYF